MKTTKPISTISYNSKDFLIKFLDELLTSGNIYFWCAIFHYGENGDKDHFHVYLEPNKSVDTMQLRDLSCEFVDDNPLPLRCIDWRKSKSDEWVMYNTHDTLYLRTKFEEKEYTYSKDKFFSSESLQDELKHFIESNLCSSDVARDMNVLTALQDRSAAELCFQGYIKPREAFYFKTFDELQKEGQKIINRKNELKLEQELIEKHNKLNS